MKKIVLSALTVCSLCAVQAQPIQWLDPTGGSSNEEAKALTTDANGNIYSAGYFTNSVDFDAGTNVSNLNSFSGSGDGYVRKTDANGNFIWAVQLGGIYDDIVNKIAVDPNGDVIVSGHFFGSMDAEPGAGVTTLTSNGDFDVFVIKLSANGTLIWAKSFGAGSGSDDILLGMDLDANGNIYTVGYFIGTGGDYDPGPGTVTLTSNGFYNDGFISKLDNNGNFQWVKQIAGNLDDYANAVRVNASAVYVTGSFKGTVDFDFGAGTANLVSAGQEDAFILKLDLNGNYQWAKKMGGTFGNEMGRALALDNSGAVYTLGNYTSPNTDFDPGANNITLSPAGGQACFIQRLNDDGSFSFARQITGQFSAIIPTTAHFSDQGELIFMGYYNNTADFDPGVTVNEFTSQGNEDMFIARLNSMGTFVSAYSYGGVNVDKVYASTVTSNGTIYAAGSFFETIAMMTQNGITIHSGPGALDAIVFKINSCQNNTGTDVQTACNSFTWIDGNTYTSSNNTATHLLTNQGGCDSLVTLNLTITTLPTNTISANGNVLSTGATGVFYQWVNCGTGSLIAGANSASYTAPQDGVYAVMISDGTCFDTSACFTYSTIGLEDLEQALITLSPNPTTKLVLLSMQATVMLYNAQGALVLSVNDADQLDLGELPSGVYICELYQAGQWIQRNRIVKQ